MDRVKKMFVSNITDVGIVDSNDQMDTIFEALDVVSRLTGASLFVIDFAKNSLVYKSGSLAFVKDAEPSDFQRDSASPYWSLMKEEDFTTLMSTRDAYFKLVKDFTHEEMMHHTFIIDYQIHLNRREIFVTQKFAPIMLNSDGELWMGLFLITQSPRNKHHDILVITQHSNYKFDSAAGKFIKERKRVSLNSIERSIIYRASNGMTTEEIADDMCRSVNTIKTYKTRLFKKLKVTSMTQAIIVASNHNLLTGDDLSRETCIQ